MSVARRPTIWRWASVGPMLPNSIWVPSALTPGGCRRSAMEKRPYRLPTCRRCLESQPAGTFHHHWPIGYYTSMKRLLVLSSVLLLGGVVGCVGQDDLQALRADVMALERQRASRERDTEQRAGLERTAHASRKIPGRRPTRDGTSNLGCPGIALEIQNLRGEVQETRHRMRRGTLRAGA